MLVVVAWIGTRTWTAAAPTLIRPRFTWQGGEPIEAAIAPLQFDATTLVAAAMIAVIVRQLWIGTTLVSGPSQEGLVRALSRPFPPSASTDDDHAVAVTTPGRRTVSDVVRAGVATLVLAGILEHVWLAALAFGVFLMLRLLRSDVLDLPGIAEWKALTARAPAAVRLIVLWVLARVGTNALSNDTITSYTGLAIMVVVGSILVWIVFPGQPRDPNPPSDDDAKGPNPPPPTPAPPADRLAHDMPAPPRPTTSPSPRPPHPSSAMWRTTSGLITSRLVATLGVTLGVLVVAVVTAQPALADNCGTFTDCFNQSNAAAEAGFGLTLLSGLFLLAEFTVAGDVRAFGEAVSGRDLLTGEQLSGFDRFVAGGSVVFFPLDFLRVARRGGDVLRLGDDLVGLGRHGDDVTDIGRHTDNLADPADVRRRTSDLHRDGTHLPHPPERQQAIDDMVAEYLDDGTSSYRKGKISERLGEHGAASTLEQLSGRNVPLLRPDDANFDDFADLVDAGQPWPGAATFNGRNVTNVAWFDGNTLHVIEAKGGDGRYGDRLSNLRGNRIDQTDPEYPLDVAADMKSSPKVDGRNTIGNIIEQAYQEKRVQYFSVRTGKRNAIRDGNPATWIEHIFRQ